MENPVAAAFTKQSGRYDQDDIDNPVLRAWRQQVYRHVERYVKPGSSILELNAGTGIDALYFAKRGHRVHATDISEGMIEQIRKKIADHNTGNNLTFQQCSFEHLDRIDQGPFNYVFSNLGGLNCTENLVRVTRNLPQLLHQGAIVTWVVMPPIAPWEILSLFNGNRDAFRRLKRYGTAAQVEGITFRTWYHSVTAIRKALGPAFKKLRSESLGLISPPPSSGIPGTYPRLDRFLSGIDFVLHNKFPFNRWGDHVIVSFRYER